MRVLGIDPGSLHAGFGLVERSGSNLRALEAGRVSCPRDLTLPERLAFLSFRFEELCDRLAPDVAAIEATFHGPNTRSLIVLAQARGALLATLARRALPVAEYSPAEVKSAIAGDGRADKEQVAKMVRLLLGTPTQRLSVDASDALAIALCCAQRHRFDRLAARR